MASQRQSEALWAIFGLGNPGRQYVNTRHNLGFRVIDKLAHHLRIKLTRQRFNTLFGGSPQSGARLAKPLTFVNKSGEAVKKFVQWYKIPLQNLLVIYDDVNLPLGTIRIRKKGSSGGHLGLESIIEELETNRFPRLRLGIKPGRIEFAPSRPGLVDFVLGGFSKEEEEIGEMMIDKSCQAVLTIIERGIGQAMNIFNRAA